MSSGRVSPARPGRRGPAGRLAVLAAVLGWAAPWGHARAADNYPILLDNVRERGVSLGLFAEDPGLTYGPLLDEIAAMGATHVSLVVPRYQHDVRASRIYRHPRLSPAPGVLARVMAQARARGLAVVVFPILQLEVALTEQEWRGAIRPRDPDRWWRSYRAWILELARVAARGGAQALCVGSELSTMDRDAGPWRALVREVRRVFRGRLVYSANWDAFERVALWPLVDVVGVSVYFALHGPAEAPTLHRLVHGAREHRVAVDRWQARTGREVVITELGCHSRRGAAARPWAELPDSPVDLALQARYLRAMARVWRSAPYLRGVYLWNWFGHGGPRSGEYTPRGKPAARVLCEMYGVDPARCPTAYGVPGAQGEVVR